MPDVMLPSTALAFLAEFRSVFTRPSFESFVVLVAGFVHALGKHRITDALRAAGPSASKHYGAYYRFLSAGRWSLDQLGLALLALVGRLLPCTTVELVVDDTLVRHTGKKVSLATMHADPLLKQGGRPFMSYGHVFVVLAVHVRLPGLSTTGWALPFMFRLFESSRTGGRADSTSDKRRAMNRRRRDGGQRDRQRMTDRHVVEGQLVECDPIADDAPPPRELRPTKLQLAAEMILLVATRLPHVRFRVLADHGYYGKELIQVVRAAAENVHFITRGQPDAALYDLPPPRTPGQRGRPRVKGERLPNPKQWAQADPSNLTSATVGIYGHQVSVRLGSYCGMAYRTLPGQQVRYAVVQDPAGIYKDDYFLCTDLDMSTSDIVEAFSRRWPLERTFQDCKQKLGIQDPEVQRPASVRRVVPLLMVVYSLVVLWFITDGAKRAQELSRPMDPWYTKTCRPSFTDMLASFRRLSWSKPIADPPSGHLPREKLMTEYLLRVVAAA